MRAIRLVSCLGALVVLASAGAGVAAEEPVTPFVERGWLNGRGQVYGLLGISGSSDGTLDTTLGGGVGITDRITVDGSLGTVSLAPEARYHHPNVGLWVGLVDTPPFELDATTRVTFGVGEDKPVSRVEPGAIAIFRMGRAVRLDTGAHVLITPGTSEAATTIGIRVPASLGVQLGRHFHVAVSSGVTIDDFANAACKTSVPLGLALGISARLPGGSSMGLMPSVSWPRLVDTGRTGENTPIATVVGAMVSIASP